MLNNVFKTSSSKAIELKFLIMNSGPAPPSLANI